MGLQAVPLAAQQPAPDRGRPWIAEVSHWGRWVGLAGAVGMIGVAAAEHQTGQEAFDALESLCLDDPARCQLLPGDGETTHYVDPEAEQLFQEYAAHDRRARGYLLGGQLTLVVAGGMFLIDLLYDDDRPENIPFTPLELYSTRNQLGFSIRF
jgi:hypothetical protein